MKKKNKSSPKKYSEKYQPDRKFQELAAQISKAVINNNGMIGDQSEQVKLMVSLERKFQYYIQKTAQTEDIYKKFIAFITEENGNILSARPYFRERNTTFSESMVREFKNKNPKGLYPYKINFMFIRFLMDRWTGDMPERAKRYLTEYIQARSILIENNLPLVINRAKLFYRKTPKTHLGLLDFINTCTIGLCNGIDKYVGDYTKVWRSVCIGRMTLNMIEEYSETFLRLYPSDKKILYRINQIKNKLGTDDLDKLTQAVKDSYEQDKSQGKPGAGVVLDEPYVRSLINGISYVPVVPVTDGENYTSVPGFYEDEIDYDVPLLYDSHANDNTEEQASHLDAMAKVSKASEELDLIETKVIRLKGVDL